MSTATDMRDLYLQAEQDILQHGKTTVFDGKTLAVENLSEIRKGRQEWERRVTAELTSSVNTRAGLGVSVASFGDA